jgi:hypothetical protein
MHFYSTADIFRCSVETGVSWVHAMGDSQEREFVAHMKMVRNDGVVASKFEQVGDDWVAVWPRSSVKARPLCA